MVQSAETELEYELSIDGKTAYTGHQTLMLVGGINFAQERRCIKGCKALVAERLRQPASV